MGYFASVDDVGVGLILVQSFGVVCWRCAGWLDVRFGWKAVFAPGGDGERLNTKPTR